MARNVSYMLNLYHTSKYVIENGSINTFSNMPDDGLFVEERLSYEGLISKICMTLGWDPAHVKLHLSLIFDSSGGRRVVKIKNDSHVEFMNRVDPMSCLDLYIDLEDITQEEREASLENVSFGGFPRRERASTSRNRDEEETPLFAQNDYREESDSDYKAPSESEEDCDVFGESDFEESDDERLENEEMDCNLLARRYVYSKMGNWDASCVDKDEFALKMWDETPEGMDIGVCFKSQSEAKHAVKLWNIHHKREYTVAASSPRTWAVRCRTFNVESEDGEPPCEWKMRVSLKAHGLHEIVRWHDAHNCMTPVNDNDNRYIAALKFTNPETVVEWEWKEGQEESNLVSRYNSKKVKRDFLHSSRYGPQRDQLTSLRVEDFRNKWVDHHSAVRRYWNRREEFVLRDLEEGDLGSVYEGYYEWFMVNTVRLISNPGNYEPQGYETSSSRVKLYGEVLNNIRVSTERFREKREDDNLLDEELDKHLDDIINQTHTALTLGADDEMEVEDTQILVDEDPSLPSQPPPDKKAKPWSRDKIGGGRKRKVTIPPRTSQQQTEGQQNEDQAHSSRGSRIQVETHFEEAGGPETQFDLGGPETQFGGQSQPQPGVKFLTIGESQSQPQIEAQFGGQSQPQQSSILTYLKRGDRIRQGPNKYTLDNVSDNDDVPTEDINLEGFNDFRGDSPPHSPPPRRSNIICLRVRGLGAASASAIASASASSSTASNVQPWVVTRTVVGGPHDSSIIPNFLGHVAHRLTDKSYKPSLEMDTRVTYFKLLKEWKGSMSTEDQILLAGRLITAQPGTVDCKTLVMRALRMTSQTLQTSKVIHGGGVQSGLVAKTVRAAALALDQVEWLPYGPDPVSDDPRTICSGWIQYRDIIESYLPSRVLRQIGYIQVIPPPIPHPLSANSSGNHHSYKVSWRPTEAFDAWMQFPFSTGLTLEYFERSDHDKTACAPTYLQWYLKYLHPFLVLDATTIVSTEYFRTNIIDTPGGTDLRVSTRFEVMSTATTTTFVLTGVTSSGPSTTEAAKSTGETGVASTLSLPSSGVQILPVNQNLEHELRSSYHSQIHQGAEQTVEHETTWLNAQLWLDQWGHTKESAYNTPQGPEQIIIGQQNNTITSMLACITALEQSLQKVNPSGVVVPETPRITPDASLRVPLFNPSTTLTHNNPLLSNSSTPVQGLSA
ncbi:OLC1v1005243C1 [Oldenlandia corymbosa var. corymbosa]|uniref:OLC1v1005243C1 n=1 Tax=Oldenlandia corymbosa var. corymbosa TaxID=529605 RepID=A0AAV1DE73_OLDCO|nr:OLC1v1005243C1 [Oldenlandia corymbosa var. corymbosa]